MKTIGEQAVAEFLGTLALVFIGAGCVVIAIANGGGYVGVIGVALAHGLVLAISPTWDTSRGATSTRR